MSKAEKRASRQQEYPRPRSQGRSRFGVFKEQQKSQGGWSGVNEWRGIGKEVREAQRGTDHMGL